MTKIYFAGSIRGGRDDRAIYREIIRLLKTYGEVVTEHVGLDNLDAGGEEGLSDRDIHDRDLGWLEASDLVVAEVTTPSLGVGYEIARASAAGKPLLCLFRPTAGKKLSAMIAGCPGILVAGYSTPDEIPRLLHDFFSTLPLRLPETTAP